MKLFNDEIIFINGLRLCRNSFECDVKFERLRKKNTHTYKNNNDC